MDDYTVNPIASRAGGVHLVEASAHGDTSSSSGVSWGAILAGAAGAAALSLILLLLGTGLGLSTVSPWAGRGVSASAIGVASILWLSFTQLAAAGMGGYLAGRLRTKWAGVHTDEVYFRDTAHGFLAWAVATLLTAALLTSAVGSILGAGAQAGATAASGVAVASTAVGASTASASEASPGGLGYFIDSLFRRERGAGAPADVTTSGGAATPSGASSTPERSNVATTSEVTRIFMNSIRTGALPAADSTYLAQVVAQRTGLSQPEAEKRVAETYAKAQAALNEAKTKAQEAADAARKASAYTSLWLVVSMLIGAFVASFAATYGGRRRDL